MKFKFLNTVVTSLILTISCLVSVAHAGLIFSTEEVVTDVTNSATFDSLTVNGLSLSNYIEDGINITVDDITYTGFDSFNLSTSSTAFHYGSSGNETWVELSLINGNLINSLDFLLGDGNGGINTYIHYEAFTSGTSIGSGHELVAKGTVGFTSVDGFDTIRLSALLTGTETWGDYQAIALDDIRIGNSVQVPEPTTLAIFALGMIGLASRRFKKQS